MPYRLNPHTGRLDFYEDAVGISGKLNVDQSTPQTIINGIPLLASTRVINANRQIVDKEFVDTADALLVPYTGANKAVDLGVYSLTTPSLIGGIAVGSKITYKSTTGIGTTTGIAHQFVGGTDGATVAATILNNGNVGIGTTAPTAQLSQHSTAALESGVLSAELLAGGGWTATGWTGTNPFTHTTGNVTALSNTFAAVINTYYQITYTITGRTVGSVVIALGGHSTAAITATGAFGPRAITTGNFTVTPTTGFDGTITLSVKSITAYGATYNILDNTGTANIEIRSSLASLNNTFMGKNAGRQNTTGNYNSAQGVSALYSNTTGSNNSAQGYGALYSNTTGFSNSIQGAQALYYNTTGNYNSAQGVSALYSNTTGNYNSAQGYGALYSNTTGYNNSAQGVNALFSNTIGYNNSAHGMYALFSNTTGSTNSAQGMYAGRSIIDGNSNTFVGYGAGYHASQKTNAVNSMALGNGTYTTLDNQVIIGNASVNVGLAQTIPTARLHLPAGVAGAGGAPFKIATGGVLNTTPEAGAIETDANNIYWVRADGTRLQLNN